MRNISLPDGSAGAGTGGGGGHKLYCSYDLRSNYKLVSHYRTVHSLLVSLLLSLKAGKLTRLIYFVGSCFCVHVLLHDLEVYEITFLWKKEAVLTGANKSAVISTNTNYGEMLWTEFSFITRTPQLHVTAGHGDSLQRGGL